MSKKPLIVLSSSSHFLNASYVSPMLSPTTTGPYHPPKRHPKLDRSQRRLKIQRCSYATVKDSDPISQASTSLLWPELPTFSSIPTPYQIFQLDRAAPYSKRRFYELVKLYHPDRHGYCCNLPHIDGLSHEVKMKRYRLVVAANEILSDPSRRRAYDQCKAGWTGDLDTGEVAHHWNLRTESRWSGFHDNESPANNATWEDWEKWYHRDPKAPQTPVYLSNGGFVFLVALITAASAIGQASRVDGHKNRFDERADIIHQECNKDLHQRQKETRELSSSNQAILRLVRAREQSGLWISPTTPDDSFPDDRELEPP